MELVLLGAPGAGKGTQAKRLADYYHVPHVSTGDIFRKNLSERTELGQTAQEYMSQGLLVPDAVTEAMVDARLQEPDAASGFILDGFPRTLSQGQALDKMLERAARTLDGVAYLRVARDRLIFRLTGRRVCPQCGATFHLEFNPPEIDGVCDRCGTPLVQRPDDSRETVLTRLSVYDEQTAPLIEYYQEAGLLIQFDGDQPVEALTQQIVDRLGGQHD